MFCFASELKVEKKNPLSELKISNGEYKFNRFYRTGIYSRKPFKNQCFSAIILLTNWPLINFLNPYIIIYFFFKVINSFEIFQNFQIFNFQQFKFICLKSFYFSIDCKSEKIKISSPPLINLPEQFLSNLFQGNSATNIVYYICLN